MKDKIKEFCENNALLILIGAITIAISIIVSIEMNETNEMNELNKEKLRLEIQLLKKNIK